MARKIAFSGTFPISVRKRQFRDFCLRQLAHCMLAAAAEPETRTQPTLLCPSSLPALLVVEEEEELQPRSDSILESQWKIAKEDIFYGRNGVETSLKRGETISKKATRRKTSPTQDICCPPPSPLAPILSNLWSSAHTVHPHTLASAPTPLLFWTPLYLLAHNPFLLRLFLVRMAQLSIAHLCRLLWVPSRTNLRADVIPLRPLGLWKCI